MARTRHNHRRRRGRFAFLLKLFAFVIAAAAMLWAAALFFRMDHIVISGNERYTEAEVLAASGLQTGGNLYFLNKFDVKEAIFEQLPYVDTIRINRKLPDTLLIEVSECKAAAGVQSGQTRDMEAELDYERGKQVYEVSFKSGGYEYDVKVDAKTGAVIRTEREWDD